MRISVRRLDDRLEGWGFPRWGSSDAAGLDLHACIDRPMRIAPQQPPLLIPAGIVVMIGDPEWCGFILPRSGLGHRDGLVLGNGTGVIDADYTGPILVSAWNRNPARGPGLADDEGIWIEPGDRIAQLVFVRVTRPQIDFIDTAEPHENNIGRGEGGFGSTGRR